MREATQTLRSGADYHVLKENNNNRLQTKTYIIIANFFRIKSNNNYDYNQNNTIIETKDLFCVISTYNFSACMIYIIIILSVH